MGNYWFRELLRNVKNRSTIEINAVRKDIPLLVYPKILQCPVLKKVIA